MTEAARSDQPAPALRAARIDLCDLLGARIFTAPIVVAGDDFPDVVMFRGNPFLRDRSWPALYRQVRPYRLDDGA